MLKFLNKWNSTFSILCGTVLGMALIWSFNGFWEWNIVNVSLIILSTMCFLPGFFFEHYNTADRLPKDTVLNIHRGSLFYLYGIIAGVALYRSEFPLPWFLFMGAWAFMAICAIYSDAKRIGLHKYNNDLRKAKEAFEQRQREARTESDGDNGLGDATETSQAGTTHAELTT